jgi:FkbM family methyltransferase
MIFNKINEIKQYVIKKITYNINNDFNNILKKLFQFLKKNKINNFHINYNSGKLIIIDKFNIKYIKDFTISNLRNIEFNKIVDELELEFIFRNFKDGQDFIDIGSSFGTYSLFVNKFFPKSNIFSFEPNFKYYKIQKENIKLNNFNKIKLFNMGCYDNTLSKVSFKDLDGGSYLAINKNLKKKIQVVNLDKFIKKKTNIGYIKIDVEGAEYKVLKGLENIMDLSRPIVQIELSTSFLMRFNDSIIDIFNYFKIKDYLFIRKQFSKKTIRFIKSNKIYFNSTKKNTKSCHDFIMIPKEKIKKINFKKKINIGKLFYS